MMDWTLAVDAPRAGGLWWLFTQSFDLFTVVLLAFSIVGMAWVVRCLVEVRASAIVPVRATKVIDEASRAGNWDELRAFVSKDGSMSSLIVRAALFAPLGTAESRRELAELTASEESARWFRKIEPLNVIGNLGPLVGLAGTVWGMVLAFTTLGEQGGQSGPTDLSLGISKALFHTLLGLCVAIPCLLVYGLYRGIVDRHCTRATIVAAGAIERVPERV